MPTSAQMRLTALTNDSWLDPQVNDEAKPVVAELLAAVEQAVGADPDDEGFRALLSAHALVQGRERATSSAPDLRDQNMAAQLQRTSTPSMRSSPPDQASGHGHAAAPRAPRSAGVVEPATTARVADPVGGTPGRRPMTPDTRMVDQTQPRR